MDRLGSGGLTDAMTTTSNSTLVMSGTGKTGSRVAHRLAGRGVRVRLGSRSGRTPFDWDDRGTWPAALAGVSAAYVVYVPDLGIPGAADAVAAFTRVAVDQGLDRLVLLSGRGEAEAQRCEEAVRRSGLEWTVVRAAFFAQNFSEGFLADAVRQGDVALPAGGVAEPVVDVDDIADVAVAALTEPGHGNRVYDVTGPRSLTFADVAARISAAARRDVRYVPVTPERFASAMVADGTPAELAAHLGDLFADIMDGHNAHVGDGVQRALGREPRDFDDFVAAAAAAGIWSPTGVGGLRA